jgi:effector-binding domain-containing protein
MTRFATVRTTLRGTAAALVILLCALGGSAPAWALQDTPHQQAPDQAAPAEGGVPKPGAVESQPLSPPPGSTEAQQAPAAPANPAGAAQPAPGASAGAAPAPAEAADVQTLAPPPGDQANPDEVDVAARPAATIRAQSSWDEGYETLTTTFARLADEMRKAGIKVTGRPLSTFVETDDNGFRFEAQLPIESAPSQRPAGLSPDVTFGQTPSGHFIRFVHRSPYDDIDSTYEAVSAYLDSKGIEVKDNFTEEYVNAGKDAGDPAMELFIYVQPRG